MSRPLWTPREIEQATGGCASGAFAATGVSIDTRSLEPGDLFVALTGERDGHEFVAQAMAKGAAGVLASQPVAAPAVIVDDTFKALEALGVFARDRAPARRGAVTGSVGKTSVTRAVEAGLRLAGPGHASVKSYNNHIGVPLTLARMPAETERAVFEVGMNHADEITPLSKMIRPHAAAITTVGPVHIENFPEGEAGIVRAKAEIFDGMAPGGIAVLNADNAAFEALSARATAAGLEIWSFGAAPGAQGQLLGFAAGEGIASVEAMLFGERLTFPILNTGAHWGPNSLCVLLMLAALDVELQVGLEALATFRPIEGRGAEKTVRVAGGAFTLIDESYNANPLSMTAAFKSLGARKTGGRRIVALTDMLELGAGSAQFHAGLAPALDAAAVDLVFCAGPMMKSLWDALPQNRRGGYAMTAAELAPMVASAVGPGDLVMVKGSNGSKAAAIAAALAQLDAGEV